MVGIGLADLAGSFTSTALSFEIKVVSCMMPSEIAIAPGGDESSGPDLGIENSATPVVSFLLRFCPHNGLRLVGSSVRFTLVGIPEWVTVVDANGITSMGRGSGAPFAVPEAEASGTAAVHGGRGG